MLKFAYCLFYQTGEKNKHQFAAGYNPMAPKDAIQLAYLTRPSQRLQLFTEFKGSFDGSSSYFMSGFRLRFLQGVVTGSMDTKLKVCSTFTKSMDETSAIPLKIDWFSMIDFSNARRPCNFGVNISIGQM